MTVVKDPELLRELKPLWRRHGCAFCGRTVPDTVESGFDVELAHIQGRGMGGGSRLDTVENIVGACGDLSENRCHRRLDAHEIVLFVNSVGDQAWSIDDELDPLYVRGRPSWYGLVRRLRGSQAERVNGGANAASSPTRSAGALLQGAFQHSTRPGVDDLVVTGSALSPDGGDDGTSADFSAATEAERVDEPEAVRERQDLAGTPAAGTIGSDLVPVRAGRVEIVDENDTPEGRHVLIRELIRQAEKNRLAAALLLMKAWEDAEYEKLDMTWPEYYGDVGLVKSEVSKMLRVAQTFRGQLLTLPRADQAEMSLERAYYAARIVRAELMSHSEALSTAASTPTSGLVAILKGDEPADRCVCPTCGSNHVKNAEKEP